MKKNVSKKIILSTVLLGFSSSLFAATEVEDSHENEHETVVLNQEQVQNEYRHRYGNSEDHEGEQERNRYRNGNSEDHEGEQERNRYRHCDSEDHEGEQERNRYRHGNSEDHKGEQERNRHRYGFLNEDSQCVCPSEENSSNEEGKNGNRYQNRYGQSGQEHGMNVEMGLSHGEGHKYGIGGHIKFNGEDKELNCECPSEDTNLDLTGGSVVDTERVTTDTTNSIEIPESDISDITRQINSLDNVSEEDKNSIKDKILNEISTNPDMTVEERNAVLDTIVRDTVNSTETPTVSEENEEGISEELFTETETPDIVNSVPAPQIVEETFFSSVYLGKDTSIEDLDDDLKEQFVEGGTEGAETGISTSTLPYSGRHLRVSKGNSIYVKLKVCENGKKGFEVVTTNNKVPEKISFDSCTQAKVKIVK